MQLLHLIDSSVAPTSLMFHASRHAVGTGELHSFMYVGPAGLADLARRAGLPPGVGVPDVSWNNPRAWLMLSRAIDRLGRVEGVHCLSLRGAGIARVLLRNTPTSVTLTAAPAPHHLSRMERFGLASRTTRYTVTHPAICRVLEGAGIAAERVETADPVVDRGRLETPNRAALRADWSVADHQTVVALLGDPAHRTDALQGMLAVGLAREAGRDVVMLASPRAAHLRRALHVAGRFERGPRIIRDPRVEEPWRSLPGCDAAVALSGGLSVHWAMAAGLPVIAPDTPDLRHTLAGYAHARFAAAHSAGDLARKLCAVAGEGFGVSKPQRD